MLKVKFIFNGSHFGNLDVNRVKERVLQDTRTSLRILGACHNDAVEFSLLSDTNGINFSGKIICSCKRDLVKFRGNTNDFEITYDAI